MDPIMEKDNLITSLHELQHAIGEGDIEKIKEIINWFHQDLARNKQLLSELYTRGIQCTTQTDLILTACRNRQTDILCYILNETDILVHLTDDSFDDTEVNQQRTEVFKHVLCLDTFKMVEMLYDYWCGNLHWTGHDINNIKMVGDVLKNAFVVIQDGDTQLKANFRSLIKFNDFQCEIYTKIAQLKPSYPAKPKETATMLLKLLRVYDEYSHLEKLGIKISIEGQELITKAKLKDKSSMFTRSLVYNLYEVYYRKLDFNVILLILENLSVLREHLKDRLKKYINIKDYPKLFTRYEHDAKTYKEIECAIYYFIYRTSEDWRLYLPKKRLFTKDHYTQDGRKKIPFTIDLHKLYNGPVLSFERKYLKKCINKLKKILKVHFICRDPASVMSQNQIEKSKVTFLDENYLQTIRYMSDHYSLKKVVYYIEAIENTNYIVLNTDHENIMIERVLHVIGEMLKSTDNTYHLSRSTNALLQISISVETISQLHNIRNSLSHADTGQLSTRIDMANTQDQTFAEIKEELIIIKKFINPVLVIYKSILDKSFFEKGLRLLEQRIEGLPDEASRHIDEIYRLYNTRTIEFSESSQYNQEVWRHTGFSIELLKEIAWIVKNKKAINSNIQFIKTRLSNNFANMLPAFIQFVRRMLHLITENNDNVSKLNQQLFDYDVKMCDFPDGNEINRIQNKAERLMKNNINANIDLGLTKKIKNYTIHWNCIKEMLSFCFNYCELFASISHLNLNSDSLPDTPTVIKVFNIISELEAISLMHRFTLARILGKRAVVWGLSIVDRLFDWMGLIFNPTHYVAIEKLHDIVCKKIKPDDSRIAREKLISCLIKRLDLLKQILLYPQQIPLSQQVGRFNCDVQFRVTLEMLLADIGNVLKITEYDDGKPLMKKSSKLLREVDLGNVLDHGNPFLEVIGNVFNSHDLAAEFLDKAIMFANDGQSIEALHELFRGGMDYQAIIAGDLLQMNDQQKVLYEQLKKSSNWESYAKLTQSNPKDRRKKKK